LILFKTIYDVYEYNAKLIRVIDGDTIDASIDLGFDVWVRKRIRLHGIDAPESRTRDLEEKKRGIASTEFLRTLMEANNGDFIVRSEGVGKYGRCLGVIIIAGDNINDKLIKEGHAKEYMK
jgi:endonuclease YncB( thermonuclease family)